MPTANYIFDNVLGHKHLFIKTYTALRLRGAAFQVSQPYNSINLKFVLNILILTFVESEVDFQTFDNHPYACYADIMRFIISIEESPEPIYIGYMYYYNSQKAKPHIVHKFCI